MGFRAKASVSVMALVLIAAAPAGSALAAKPALPLQVYAQAEKPTLTKRVQQWTKARLDAAKKRWALNDVKFSACSKELAEMRKKKRLSYQNQGRFLEDCMRRP